MGSGGESGRGLRDEAARVLHVVTSWLFSSHRADGQGPAVNKL